MPPPRRTAGSRLPHWGSAALLSVGVHGLLAWAWWAWVQADGPLGRARHLGAPLQPPLRVHLVAAGVSARASPPPNPDTLAAPSPDSARAANHASAPAPGRLSPLAPWARRAPLTPQTTTQGPSAAPLSSAAPAPAPTQPDPSNAPALAPVAPPPQATPASPMGGRFAGLFAPITTQALGRGGWARATPHSPEDEATPHWREQQAMVAASQAMRQRTQAWLLALQSPAAPALTAACEVRMSLTARSMQVSCQDASDQARLAQALGGDSTGAQPPDAPKPSDLQCLHAEGKVANWVACPDTDGGAGDASATPPLAAR